MTLTPQQITQFEGKVYLFFPALFSRAEITPLQDGVPKRCTRQRPEHIAHRDGTLLACLPDDCRLEVYDVPLPWKDGTPEAAFTAVPAPALAA
jgi:hypothetical protein